MFGRGLPLLTLFACLVLAAAPTSAQAPDMSEFEDEQWERLRELRYAVEVTRLKRLLRSVEQNSAMFAYLQGWSLQQIRQECQRAFHEDPKAVRFLPLGGGRKPWTITNAAFIDECRKPFAFLE